MNFAECLRTLESMHGTQKEKALHTERMKLLLELLGHPDHSFETVLVGGTSGKGSTAAFLSAILRQDGKNVGLFLSPHVQAVTERMQVNGVLASMDEFAHCFSEAYALSEKVAESSNGTPTAFELLAASAMLHFKKKGVDVAVVEVGLGGKLDATNAMEPKASIVTNIDLDHTEILGNTVEQISKEKAGIMREGRNAYTAATGNALQCIWQEAIAHNAPVLSLGTDFHIENLVSGLQTNWFAFRFQDTLIKDLRTNLIGSYQVENAALAIACAINDFAIGEESIRFGLRKAFLPARFEFFESNLVVLDGAHNPAKTRALAGTLSMLDGTKAIVFAASKNKDARSMLKELAPHTHALIATEFRSTRECFTAAEVENMAREEGIVDITVEPDPLKAVELAKGKGDRAVVTGSLYLCGQVREKYYPTASILERKAVKW